MSEMNILHSEIALPAGGDTSEHIMVSRQFLEMLADFDSGQRTFSEFQAMAREILLRHDFSSSKNRD